MNESPPPPVEASASETPPPAPPAQGPAAPPPAAALVVGGAIRSERELQLQTELDAARAETATAQAGRRKAEFDAAERERLAQELIAQTKAQPAQAPKPPKVRRFGPIPILRSDEE